MGITTRASERLKRKSDKMEDTSPVTQSSLPNITPAHAVSRATTSSLSSVSSVDLGRPPAPPAYSEANPDSIRPSDDAVSVVSDSQEAPAEHSSPEPDFTAPAPLPASVMEKWRRTMKELYCPQCVIPFGDTHAAYYHLVAHQPHENRKTRCAECAALVPTLKDFKQHLSLTSHMLVRRRDELVVSGSMTAQIGLNVFSSPGCKYCKITFSEDHQQRRTREHMLAEHHCQWCCMTFQRPKDRQNHMDTTHVKCPVCARHFPNANALAQHRALPQTIFPGCLEVPSVNHYRCLKCWKSFCGLDAMILHRGIHRSARPYVCEDCPESGNYDHIQDHVMKTGHMRILPGLPPPINKKKKTN
jgi:hypothetical protein